MAPAPFRISMIGRCQNTARFSYHRAAFATPFETVAASRRMRRGFPASTLEEDRRHERQGIEFEWGH
jgi:hypothetical protein